MRVFHRAIARAEEANNLNGEQQVGSKLINQCTAGFPPAVQETDGSCSPLWCPSIGGVADGGGARTTTKLVV
jgi:hypothetical protein